jgi:hypothetical protein
MIAADVSLPFWLKVVIGVCAVSGIGAVTVVLPTLFGIGPFRSASSADESAIVAQADNVAPDKVLTPEGHAPDTNPPEPVTSDWNAPRLPVKHASAQSTSSPAAPPSDNASSKSTAAGTNQGRNAARPTRSPQTSRPDSDPPAAAANASDNGKPKRPAPLSELRARHGLLRVSPPKRSVFGTQTDREIENLGRVFVTDGDPCKLELIGGDVILGGESRLALRPGPRDGANITWLVNVEPTGQVGSTSRVAEFQLDDENLVFHWDAGLENAPEGEALRYCLLRVMVGKEEVVCRLSEPDQVEPARLRVLRGSAEIELAKAASDQFLAPYAESLQIDLAVSGLQLDGTTKVNGLRTGQNATVSLTPAATDKAAIEPKCELVIELPAGPAKSLPCKMMLYPQTHGGADIEPPDEDAPLATEISGNELKSIEDRLRKLRKEAQTIKQDLGGAQQRLLFVQALGQKIRRQALERSSSDQGAIDRADVAVQQAQAIVDQISGKLDENSNQRLWWQNVQEHIKEIQKQIRFAYRLYIEIEGHEVVVCQSAAPSE